MGVEDVRPPEAGDIGRECPVHRPASPARQRGPACAGPGHPLDEVEAPDHDAVLTCPPHPRTGVEAHNVLEGDESGGAHRDAVAGAGQEISTRPFQLVTGRTWMGTAFGGARGRTDVPKIVDWYMEGKIEIDPMITHTMGLEDINKGFELMHGGKSIRSVVVY